MKRLLRCAAVLSLPLWTGGCWSGHELTDWGFVQAAAIDLTDDGAIRMTTQVYKPSGGEELGTATKGGQSYVNTDTISSSLFGASEDIAIELGRRPQWSHMQVLLIGERAASAMNIRRFTDFFSRGEGPRGTVSMLITKGEAGAFLAQRPLIERTIAQQLRSTEASASKYTAKTRDFTLLELTIRSMMQSKAAALPYAVLQPGKPPVAGIAGLAVIRFPEGRLIGTLPSTDSVYLSILNNRFKSGVLELPCPKSGSGIDAYHATASETRIRPVTSGDSVRLEIRTSLKGGIGELTCSKVETEQEVNRFNARLAAYVEERISETIEHLKDKQADLLGTADWLRRYAPARWAAWSGDWPQRFARIDYHIQVQVRLESTGMEIGKPNN
ncbi:Ger(x)C family spore germination protein [Cohnella sp. GCM10020058]|uniref:Ger(x)C family spore germination protein n=1 Tax=Cohnella sp. GCM10020058 TaxID=3317330 RepID=UPI0036429B6D